MSAKYFDINFFVVFKRCKSWVMTPIIQKVESIKTLCNNISIRKQEHKDKTYYLTPFYLKTLQG